ncbi:hypothetical protein [Marinifilum flexuosum]|uniref:Uncharacterized protein n=1 Tax=Marinifilum flexuosum TaxID=1117708 RepID=A0A419WMV5_9BACT|nr:hypothetical protein [Marinifilum flexuosum]RKD96772.1 hypothetical protein BXY64_3719 [Marinifilum flexuosum]
MGKLHYYDHRTLELAPDFVIEKFRADGVDGTACGKAYKVTRNKNEVTCKNCLREMAKESNENGVLPIKRVRGSDVCHRPDINCGLCPDFPCYEF